ncbi:condensation domain-containing protein [Streptomyces sp. NPDC050504]|uniref:condensation domain-containing protein n=1 Tax=Streptomyces sp. NPDC050504 TaxID=3365618 RepID=UPI0037AC70DB
MRHDTRSATLPPDLPEPVVPQFHQDVREVPCTGPGTLPLAACLAAVLAGYTGRGELLVGGTHFSVAPHTLLAELAARADDGAPHGPGEHIRLGAALAVRRFPGVLSATYDTDRYSAELVTRLLDDLGRALAASPDTPVAALRVARLHEAPADAPPAPPAPAAPGVREEPRGETERTVAAIWAEAIDLLAAEDIGRDDNFFAIGGHSLAAIRAAQRLSGHFGVELPKGLVMSAPTPREAAAVIAAARESAAAAAVPPPRAHPLDADLPVSPAQEAMWLSEQWTPGTTAYHAPYALTIDGALDTGALRAALSGVVRRHVVLRTAFTDDDGVPRAPVLADAEVPWREHDLTGAPQNADELLAELVEEPFDLACAPLLRADLLRLAEERHTLLLTFHHLVLDGGSVEPLLRELAAGYTGQEPPAPPLQYRDLTVRQHEVAATRRAAAAAHWARELADAPEPVAFPGARPRTAPPTLAGDHVRTVLAPRTTDAVRSLAKDLGTTPYTVLLAAFQALAHRLTGQDDLVVGTTVTTRDGAECAGLIGPFFATLPIRSTAASATAFGELVRRTQDRTAAAFAWKDVPFHQVGHGTGRVAEPPTPVLFELSRAVSVPAPPGLVWEARLIDPAAAKLDLIVTVTDDGTALRCTLTYATDRYGRADAERLLDRYARLLAGVCTAPHLPIADAPLDAPTAPAATGAGATIPAAPGVPGGGQATDTPPDAVPDVLARLWADALDLPVAAVTPDSDFFVLGGRSLDAVRLGSRLRKVLRVTVAPAQLFRTSGFAALTEVVRGHATDPDELSRRASLVLTAWNLRPEERHALIERSHDV